MSNVVYMDPEGNEHEVTPGLAFHLAVTADGSCWLSTRWNLPPGRPTDLTLFRCDGKLDAAHLIPKRCLRKIGHEWDRRCGISACRKHHHLLDSGRIKIKRELLPAALEEFAAELGIGWYLDRTYGALA